MSRTILWVGAIAVCLVLAIALLKRGFLAELARNRKEAAPVEPAPQDISRWDDEGGALPEGPVTVVPAGPTVE